MRMLEKGLSSLELSILAAISMTLDHAAVIMAVGDTAYLVMRSIGRIAFVIFAFLLAQSVEKTSSLKRFCIRLGSFALLTEPIFDLAIYKKIFYPQYQNTFFTLLAGVLAVAAYKKYGQFAAFAPIIAAQLLESDYGGLGAMLIFALWFWGREGMAYVISAFAVITTVDGLPNILAAAAIPLLAVFNGERGGEKFQLLRRWFFYFYYPAHIAAIAAVSYLSRQI